MFEIRRHEPLCDVVREYMERFFNCMWIRVSSRPVVLEGVERKNAFDINEDVIESHVIVLSVVPPNVAECYVVKERKLMS